MLRILRLLEIAFRFTQVRIVFLALNRSVKLIFHVVLLTIVLNYFFALIGLYLTQFGLNTTSNEDMRKINSLFGTGSMNLKIELSLFFLSNSTSSIYYSLSFIYER
jgi:hypothetical protein